MDPAPGARTFDNSGAAYDGFMGRYSKPLAVLFADFARITTGQVVLDVGCGPGALTQVLIDRVGVDAVFACDPSPRFVADCAAGSPGLDVRAGRAEAIPFDDSCVDAALAQLVLHFVSDPVGAMSEFRRVVRPGGTVAACVWDFEHEMEMLRHFWDAASTLDVSAPDEARVLRFGRPGETSELMRQAGLEAVTETSLRVESTYESFDELWGGFLAGIGPAGSYCVDLDEVHQKVLSKEFHRRCGSPAGSFSLGATAIATRGSVPG